jgi:2-polyprenyl-3-methyl-5-hydroxy-6-metoxy-1,4-benzoquinol methylase
MTEAIAPPSQEMRDDWDAYWAGKNHSRPERSAYDVVARFYRNYLIKPTLNRVLSDVFKPGSKLLHAGCGGGEVDADVVEMMRVTAVDISPKAVELYRQRYGIKAKVVEGNIFELSRSVPETFDGIYNLGVAEHFSPEQIIEMFGQFHERLNAGGRIVILWPPIFGLSVIALHLIHFVLNGILRRNIALHPAEPTKVSSRRQVEELLDRAGFDLEQFRFGPSDAFTYCIVVGVKR